MKLIMFAIEFNIFLLQFWSKEIKIVIFSFKNQNICFCICYDLWIRPNPTQMLIILTTLLFHLTSTKDFKKARPTQINLHLKNEVNILKWYLGHSISTSRFLHSKRQRAFKRTFREKKKHIFHSQVLWIYLTKIW